MQTTIFHGTPGDEIALQVAFNKYCTCEYEETSGARMNCCAGHDMMVHDQRALDGLAFERWQVERLLREEFGLN